MDWSFGTMLVSKKIFGKMEFIKRQYEKLRYTAVVTGVPMKVLLTFQHHRSEPAGSAEEPWTPVQAPYRWGKEWQSAWFAGDVELPDNCTGKKVFVRA